MQPTLPPIRIAGLLYLVIILCGVSSEMLVRGPIAAAPDVTAALAASEALFRLSILADAVMALSDVALAILLYVLLRAAGPVLALTATAFRLVQAAILGGNLLILAAATRPELAPQAGTLLGLHAAGYDIGLLFFAVNAILTGILLVRIGVRMIGAGIIAAGGVYLTGSILTLTAPAIAAAFQPAYLVPLVAESALAIWLLAGATPRVRRGLLRAS